MAKEGQTTCGRRTWEIVIECYLLPDAILAYLHLVDAIFLITLRYEKLFEILAQFRFSEAG